MKIKVVVHEAEEESPRSQAAPRRATISKSLSKIFARQLRGASRSRLPRRSGLCS